MLRRLAGISLPGPSLGSAPRPAGPQTPQPGYAAGLKWGAGAGRPSAGRVLPFRGKASFAPGMAGREISRSPLRRTADFRARPPKRVSSLHSRKANNAADAPDYIIGRICRVISICAIKIIYFTIFARCVIIPLCRRMSIIKSKLQKEMS